MSRRFQLVLAPALALLVASIASGGPPPHGGAPAPAQANRAAGPAAARPLTTDEIAVADLRLAGQQHVQACVARLATAPDAAARDAIQREIVATKRQTEIDVLTRLASLARTRGDLAHAHSFEDAAAQLLKPRPLALPAAAEKPAPAPVPAAGGSTR